MSIELQSISYEVRIGARVVSNVLSIDCSGGSDQINTEATISVAARPSWADERQPVEIWAKNSATGAGDIFRGEVTGFDWTYAPTKVGIVCTGLLARTRDAWGGDEDEEYTSQASDAIVRNGLEKKGIPSSQAHIEGSGWVVGTIDPIVLKSGDDVYATLISPLDDLEGYRTFELTSGVIVRLRITGAVGGASLTYAEGVQILAGPQHTRTADGIINRVIITGVEYESLVVGGPGVGEASAPNVYVTDPSGFVTERIQSNLIEDDATALLFAQRRVEDKNRRPEAGVLRVPLDPRVQPGMGITITQPGLEISGTTVRVQHVAHSISESGATTEVRWTGGAVSATTKLPPIPNFVIELFAEAIDTGSGVEPIVVLIADGSQSFDPDGTVTGYAWTITTDGTATPDSGSGPVMRSVISAATTITVDLVVTDNDNLTGEMPLTSVATGEVILVEDIYGADGTMLCSSDGELTWRVQTPDSGNATCLMPIAPTWQAWGTDTGHIYASFDKLASAPIDLGTPHGSHACTAVWIHEEDATRLWAGFDDGKVCFATVDLVALSAMYGIASTIPEGPVIEIRESIGTLGELRATAGQGYYYSPDNGMTWALTHTFDTAWRMAAGFDTNLASGLNDVAPLYNETGAAPAVPGGVEHVRGLSFGYRQQELYAADNAANLYLGAAPSFDLSVHTDTTPAIVNHMIRSGNIDRVVYMAVGDGSGDNGFVKWIPDTAAPFFIRRTGSNAGLMIGYGALHLPPVVANLLMVGGNLGGGSGVYRRNRATGIWDDVSGVGVGALPVRGWAGVVASPLNRDHWIVWGGDVMYRTVDAGVAWTQITGVGGIRDGLNIRQVEFSPTTLANWALCSSAFDSGSQVILGLVERGISNDVTETAEWLATGGPLHLPVTQAVPTGIAYTTGDDLVVAIMHDANPALGDKWVQFTGSLSGLGTSIGSVPETFRLLDGIAGRTPIVGVSNDPDLGDLWTASGGAPGRLVQLDPTFGATVAIMAAVALDAMYVSTATGIARVAYAGGTGTIVAIPGAAATFIRADRQRRTAIAALYEDPTYTDTSFRVALYDGSAWSSLPALGNFGPLGSVVPWIEVIS